MPPIDDNSGQYTEMLRITIDLSGFRAELDKVTSAYKDFLGELNKFEGPKITLGSVAAPDLSNVVKGIQEQIASLSSDLNTTLSGQVTLLQEQVDKISAALGLAVEQAETQASEAVKEGTAQQTAVRQDAAQAAISAENSVTQNLTEQVAARIEKAKEESTTKERLFQERLAQRIDQKQAAAQTFGALPAETQEQTSPAEVGRLQKNVQAQLRDEDTQTTAQFTRELQARQQVAENLGKDLAKQAKEVQATLRTTDTETTADFVRQQEIKRQASSTIETALARLAKERQAALRTTEDETTADFVRQQEIKRQAGAKLEADLVRLAKDRQATLKATESETTEDFVRQVQIRRDVGRTVVEPELNRLRQQQDASSVKGAGQELLEGLVGGSERANQVLGGTLGLTEGIAGNIVKMTASMAGWIVAWQIAQAILSTFVETLRFIPQQLEAGVKALEQDQNAALRLQAVIAQTTRLSGDFKENFEQAGEAANQVVEALREKAAELGIKFDDLKQSFSFFSEAGGNALTHNLQESVDAVTLLQLAFSGVTRDQEEERKLAQELPRILSGSVDEGARFLTLMHLNKDEWNQMVLNARDQRDLLDQIQQRLAPWIAAGEKISQSYAGIELRLQNFERLIREALAQPVFDALIDWGNHFLDLLNEHKDAIMAFARLVGQVITSFGSLLAQAAQLLTVVAPLRPLFDLVVFAIAAMLGGLSNCVAALSTMIRLVRDLSTLDWKDAKKAVEDYRAEVERTNNALAALAGLEPLKKQEGTDRLTQDTAGSPFAPGRDKKAATDAEQELREEVRKTTDAYKTQRDDIKQAIEDRTIAQRQGEKEILQSFDEEKNKIEELYETYIFIIRNNPLIPLAEQNKAIAKLWAEQQEQMNAISRQKHQEMRAETREHISQLETDTREQLSRTKSIYEQMAEDVKQAESNRTLSVADASAERRQIYMLEADALRTTLQDAIKRLDGMGAAGQEAAKKLKVELEAVNQQAKRRDTAEIMAADKSEFATRLAQLDGEAKLELQKKQEMVQQDRALQQQGLVSKRQIFESEMAEARASLLEQERIAQEEVTLAGENAEAKAKASAKVALIRQQETQLAKEEVQKRRALIQQEEQAEEEFAAKMQQLAQEQQATELQMSVVVRSTARERLNVELEILRARQANVDAAIAEKQAELQRVTALGNETEQARKLLVELQQLRNERLAIGLSEVRAAQQSGGEGGRPTRQMQNVVADHVNQSQAEVQQLTQQYVDALKALQAGQAGAAEQVTELATQLQQAKNELADWTSELQRSKDSLSGFAKDADQAFFGGNITNAINDIKSDGTRDMKATIEDIGKAAADGIKNLGAAVQQYQQARQQGGTLGGVGSLLSEGPTGKLIGAIPVAGPIINAIGAGLELIGDMFTSKARQIARSVERELSNINFQFSLSGNLTQYIQALEAERQKAIAELSGTKGGDKELKKILDDLDKQLMQAKVQAQELQIQFDHSLNVLKEQNQELGQFLGTLQQIRDEANKALAAGSPKALVQQFVNLSLLQQQKQAQDEYLQGEQKAIQDAIQLNDLMQQRVSLIKQEKMSEFELATQGAIERQVPAAIKIGQQLAQQREQFQKQLADLNNQIKLTQDRVNGEKQIYSIAADISSLHRQDEELQNYFLDEELQKLNTARIIMEGIVATGNGKLGLSQQLEELLGLGPNALQVATTTGVNSIAGQYQLRGNTPYPNLQGYPTIPLPTDIIPGGIQQVKYQNPIPLNYPYLPGSFNYLNALPSGPTSPFITGNQFQPFPAPAPPPAINPILGPNGPRPVWFDHLPPWWDGGRTRQPIAGRPAVYELASTSISTLSHQVGTAVTTANKLSPTVLEGVQKVFDTARVATTQNTGQIGTLTQSVQRLQAALPSTLPATAINALNNELAQLTAAIRNLRLNVGTNVPHLAQPFGTSAAFNRTINIGGITVHAQTNATPQSIAYSVNDELLRSLRYGSGY